MSAPDDSDRVVLRVPITFGQLREISRRAGLSGFDGKARAEYLVGCAVGERADVLLKRVREVRDAERRTFREEIRRERLTRDESVSLWGVGELSDQGRSAGGQTGEGTRSMRTYVRA